VAASQYCDPADLIKYLPPSTIAQATSGQQLQACIDASEEADSYMRGRYTLPLLAWGSDVRSHVAWIACYQLMQTIGFRPEAGADKGVVERYYRAVGWPDRAGTGWFPGIQRQAIHPDVTPAISPLADVVALLPQVRSEPMRGWQQFNSRGKPVVG
jgi:phage gp36-like protein